MVLGKQGRGLGSELCRTAFRARKKPSGCTVRYVRRWIVPIHNAHRLESLPHGYAIPKPCARGNPRVVDHISSSNFRSHDRIFCKEHRPRNHQKLLTMRLPTVVSMLMSTSAGTSLTGVNLLSDHGRLRNPGTYARPIPCPELCCRLTHPRHTGFRAAVHNRLRTQFHPRRVQDSQSRFSSRSWLEIQRESPKLIG